MIFNQMILGFFRGFRHFHGDTIRSLRAQGVSQLPPRVPVGVVQTVNLQAAVALVPFLTVLGPMVSTFQRDRRLACFLIGILETAILYGCCTIEKRQLIAGCLRCSRYQNRGTAKLFLDGKNLEMTRWHHLECTHTPFAHLFTMVWLISGGPQETYSICFGLQSII